MRPIIDLAGRCFDELTALERIIGSQRTNNSAYWRCRCSCGNEIEIRGDSLRAGLTSSCGHIQIEAKRLKIKHGEARRRRTRGKTPEYVAWAEMIRRCENPIYRAFHRYGGRGVKVCDAWRHDFPAFLAHVGRKPSPKHSMDRWPDNDGDYRPGNVRWATQTEQIANRSMSK